MVACGRFQCRRGGGREAIGRPPGKRLAIELDHRESRGRGKKRHLRAALAEHADAFDVRSKISNVDAEMDFDVELFLGHFGERKLKVAEIPGSEPPRIGGERKLQVWKCGAAYYFQFIREVFFWS